MVANITKHHTGQASECGVKHQFIDHRMSDFQKVLNKFLNGSKLRQPFLYDPYKINYRDDLKERLDNYLGRVEKLKNIGQVESYLHGKKPELKEVVAHLIRSLDEYLSGSASSSYDEFERLMDLR